MASRVLALVVLALLIQGGHGQVCRTVHHGLCPGSRSCVCILSTEQCSLTGNQTIELTEAEKAAPNANHCAARGGECWTSVPHQCPGPSSCEKVTAKCGINQPGTLGADVSQLTSVSSWSCMKSQGIKFMVARVFTESDHVDQHGLQSIKNALQAGLEVQGYVFPSFKHDPETQLNRTYMALQEADLLDRVSLIWLDIERSDWSKDRNANAAFTTRLIKESLKLGFHTGVYASKTSWSVLMPSTYVYPGGLHLPLWYAHYDGVESFADWRGPYGGWVASDLYAKQYRGDVSMCGANVDLNWRPQQ